MVFQKIDWRYLLGAGNPICIARYRLFSHQMLDCLQFLNTATKEGLGSEATVRTQCLFVVKYNITKNVNLSSNDLLQPKFWNF